jgi:quinone-modifying oxidoreductase subunit QmoC
MQTLRAQTIEHLAPIRTLSRIIGNISATWPLVIGLPMLLIIAAVYATNGLQIPEPLIGFDAFVPHSLIYMVFIPALTLGAVLLSIGALRAWKLWGIGVERKGSFVSALFRAFSDIFFHRKFSSCNAAKPRKLGHFLVMWGFIGALVVTALVVVWLALLNAKLPFPLSHPLKVIGNIAAVSLLAGGVMLLFFRTSNASASGASFAFDKFFLFIVLAIGVTGISTELFRAVFPMPWVACASYLIHLGFILTLFISLPYCKFAHFMYRTLAMTHENMRIR